MATAYVDFQELKARARIQDAVALLKLQGSLKHDQWRGPCPACRQGGERALAVNTTKQSYYCFADKKGGDVIALTAHIQGVSQRDAATFLDRSFGNSDTVHSAPVTVPRTAPPAPARRFDAEAYAKTLDPAHDSLKDLGVSPETLKFFKAGYSPSGVNRGRLALPVYDRKGELVCYCGRALTDTQQPVLTFPNGTNPHELIFNAHSVKEGPLYLVRDPLAVLQAFENGVDNVVSFLAEIGPQSLEQLAALMDERRCSSLELS